MSAETLVIKLNEIHLHNLYVQRSLTLMAMGLERALKDKLIEQSQATSLINESISRLKILQA